MHSSLHWRLRCIQDSSEDENSPPNTQTAEQPGKQSKKAVETEDSSSDYDYASCGTATPPWLSPGHTQRYTRTGQLRAAPAPAQWIPSTAPATPPASARHAPSPTTSSPILLDTPPRVPLRHTSRQATTASVRQVGRQARRHAAGPYARSRPVIREASRPVDADRSVRTPAEFPQRAHPAPSHADDVFTPASWPCNVVHLREQFNPLATVFPSVPHFGWCDCFSPCRVGSCRNSLMSIYCNINTCPFDGKCGNGLDESAKLCLGRNMRTSVLGVVRISVLARCWGSTSARWSTSASPRPIDRATTAIDS